MEPQAGGDVEAWLAALEAALRGERDSDVPCGSCTACCTSSQFIHIAPDEVDTLAHIPKKLLFAAPGLPRGHKLMGYDERGHCPMLVDGRCSIYAHRPRTCRTYDCRVFAATDVVPDKPAIAAQVERWRLTTPRAADRRLRDALRAAAAFLRDHPAAPKGPTPLAVVAVKIHALFVGRTPTDDEVNAVLTALQAGPASAPTADGANGHR